MAQGNVAERCTEGKRGSLDEAKEAMLGAVAGYAPAELGRRGGREAA